VQKPALINAMAFGEGTEALRQQTVDYIRSSDAGFYIFGARLTSTMILKFMYIWCIAIIGILKRLGLAG